MTTAKTNIVLIVSDDMGYADTPRFGDTEVECPHLSTMADNGALFTNAYVTAPICTPSRMGMVTGRNQQRYGIYDMYSKEDTFREFRKETTLANIMKENGYATGLVGKWHMGPPRCMTGEQQGHPLDHGFDEYVGIAWGMSSYRPGVPLYRGHDEFPAPKYLTDFFGDEACDFIDNHKAHPFFLMLAFNAVHAPLEAAEKDIAELGGEFPGSPDRKQYAAMLTALDRNIGRVFTALDKAGVTDNTFVIFINDNGGGGNHTPKHTRNTGRNAPLRGYKFDLYEGGIRVPMLMTWPGHIEAGTTFGEVVSSLDIVPTVLKAVGATPPENTVLDGVDLLPFLNGAKPNVPHEQLFWCNRQWDGPNGEQRPVPHVHNRAMRKGNWKMVCTAVSEDAAETRSWELYDLKRDIGEQHDVAAEWPQLVDELNQEYRTWLAQMHPPVE